MRDLENQRANSLNAVGTGHSPSKVIEFPSNLKVELNEVVAVVVMSWDESAEQHWLAIQGEIIAMIQIAKPA